jgi:hypothetical protein
MLIASLSCKWGNFEMSTTTRKKVLGIRNSQKLSDTTIPHNKHNLKFVDISDEEYQVCDAAAKRMHSFFGDIQLFFIAEWNYREYCEVIREYSSKNFQELQFLLNSHIIVLDINRLLLNLLSSVRTYLDHTETSIKRRHGHNSQVFLRFKKTCSDHYDSLFSYRFMYKLRNYAQHCGLPIGEFSASVREHPERSGEPLYEFQFGSKRDSILQDYEWGKQLRQDISEQPEFIDIDQHIHELIQSIRQINRVFAQEELKILLPDAVYIDQLAKRSGFTIDDDELGVYELEVEKDVNDKITSFPKFTGSRIRMDIVKAAINNDYQQILSIEPLP